MVMKGQYLERPTVIPAGELYLEGLFHRGRRDPAVLILAPEAPGGSPMETPIVAELAWALHRSKRPTLRFNPRGFGASQGEPGDSAARLVDAQAALASLRESAENPEAGIAVVGIQTGAALALQLARREGDLAALALLAPPPELHAALSEGPRPPTVVVLPEGDRWPGPRGRVGTLRIDEVPNTDPQFLRGLPLFGQAITSFLDAL